MAKNIQKEAPKKFQKEAKKVQRQAPKLPSFKKEAKKVQRAVPSPPRNPVKKAQKKVGKATKGWLGGEGGAQSLDQWYGGFSSFGTPPPPGGGDPFGGHINTNSIDGEPQW